MATASAHRSNKLREPSDHTGAEAKGEALKMRPGRAEDNRRPCRCWPAGDGDRSCPGRQRYRKPGAVTSVHWRRKTVRMLNPWSTFRPEFLLRVVWTRAHNTYPLQVCDGR